MGELFKNIKQRHDKMDRTRQLYEPTWDDISKLFIPYRGDVTTKVSEGSRRITTVLDSTGMEAADAAANFIHGALFGEGWARVAPRVIGAAPDSEIEYAARQVSEITSRRILDELDASNFYPVAFDFLRDLMTMGTAIMRVKELEPRPQYQNTGADFGGLNFRAVYVPNAWFMEDDNGVVDTIEIEFTMTAEQAVETWGPRTPLKIRDMANGGDPMAKVHFVQTVFPRSKKRGWTQLVKTTEPWAKVTWWKDGGIAESNQEDPIVEEGGLPYNPFIVARWMQVEGESHGRGAGHKARPDMKTLNELERQKFKAIAMDLRPPLMSPDDGIMNTAVRPGTILSLKIPKTMQFGYLRSESDYGAAQALTDELRMRVNKAFLMDVLGEKDTEPRSAAETYARQQRAFARLNGPANRIQHEMLLPVMRLVIEVMRTAGALPELSDFMRQAKTRDVDISFLSPLLVAQREATIQPLIQTIEQKIAWAANSADGRFIEDINPDGISALIREARNVSVRAFLSPSQLQARREAAAQQNAMAQAAELASVGAEIASKTAKVA